jgi:hypothetical protein
LDIETKDSELHDDLPSQHAKLVQKDEHQENYRGQKESKWKNAAVE